MRLLLDQGLARSTAAILQSRGMDATHVGDVELARANDETILAYAGRSRQVIITLDADFHDRLAIGGLHGPSVIRLRIEGLNANDAAEVIANVVQASTSELVSGAMVTVEPGRIRVRRLPVG